MENSLLKVSSDMKLQMTIFVTLSPCHLRIRGIRYQRLDNKGQRDYNCIMKLQSLINHEHTMDS